MSIGSHGTRVPLMLRSAKGDRDCSSRTAGQHFSNNMNAWDLRLSIVGSAATSKPSSNTRWLTVLSVVRRLPLWPLGNKEHQLDAAWQHRHPSPNVISVRVPVPRSPSVAAGWPAALPL